MEYLIEYGVFLLKLVSVVLILFIFFGAIASIKKSSGDKGQLKVRSLNKKYNKCRQQVMESILEGKEKKVFLKKQKKKKFIQAKHKDGTLKRVYVLNYRGDLQAKTTDLLREEVSALLQIARRGDEVVVCLESPGGVVHGYGLAASQLQRIREKEGLQLTVAVDLVAASGGYMMAVVAHKIIAAPFAILGSIGVIGQLPNINKVLKKAGIDFEMHTSGKYKRSLTMLGENTEEGRDKFKQDLIHIHKLFKKHITKFRPELSIEEVSNGDTWFGQDALDNKLIDVVQTSDDYLIQKVTKGFQVVELNYRLKETLQQKLMQGVSTALTNSILSLYNRLSNASITRQF